MNTFSPFLSLNCPCEDALRWLSQSLEQSGLRVMQTFDLHTARLGLADCPCPHHGTSECNCQMVILLVYGETPEPATLILHSDDGQTWVSLVDSLGQRANTKTVTAIKHALELKTPVFASRGE